MVCIIPHNAAIKNIRQFLVWLLKLFPHLNIFLKKSDSKIIKKNGRCHLESAVKPNHQLLYIKYVISKKEYFNSCY